MPERSHVEVPAGRMDAAPAQTDPALIGSEGARDPVHAATHDRCIRPGDGGADRDPKERLRCFLEYGTYVGCDGRVLQRPALGRGGGEQLEQAQQPAGWDPVAKPSRRRVQTGAFTDRRRTADDLDDRPQLGLGVGKLAK